jgi:hypothetical protein
VWQIITGVFPVPVEYIICPENMGSMLYTYNVHNSICLMADLQAIKLNKYMQICSFDIENMYTNIPKINTISIICNLLGGNPEINMNIQKEILHTLKMVMEQNYFQFDQHYYKQTDELMVSAPTSTVLAETWSKYTQS